LGGAYLTFSLAAGTAITMDNGSGISGYGCAGSEIRNLQLNGLSNATSAIALQLGLPGGNGAAGFIWSGGFIQNFGLAITYGDNTWRTHFQNGIFQVCGQLLLFSGATVDSGEMLSFVGCSFVNNASPFLNSINITGQVEANFVNCSFDNAQFDFGGSHASCVNCHFENPGPTAQTVPFITSSGNLDLICCVIAQDSAISGPASLISLTGAGTTSIYGLNAASNVAIASLITLSGTATLSELAPNHIGGFVALLTPSGSGAWMVDYGGGQIQTNQTVTVGGLEVTGNSGFYGTAPIAKPTVTGSKAGNAALASLMTALAALGLVIDSTT
jgi:hypothetical protein